LNTTDKYYNPVASHCGFNIIQDLRNILESLDCRNDKVLFLTRGTNFQSSEEEKIILDQLKTRQVFRYDFTVSNPDVRDLYQVIEETNQYDYDIILAIGGGSVLDVAKSICALKGMAIENVEVLRSIITSKSYASNKNKCNWIGIPTTAGTGSEVTCWATVWDNEKSLKYSIEGKDIYAKAAIIDPRLTINLPIRLTVSSALDAVCHAAESYWSKNTNQISRHFAITAISNIIQNIEKLIDEPSNQEYRAKIAYGSFFAGLAFSNTRTTACHAISYPITLMFGVDHGIAVSITLSKLLELNESYLVEKEKLLEAFGAKNCKEVDVVIKNIYNKATISPRLRDYDIKETKLAHIVKNTFANNGRIDNNPVNVTEEMLMNILSSIY
jgi:phosphonate metabolism-associated iron-containing alcohol dehydrogenase